MKICGHKWHSHKCVLGELKANRFFKTKLKMMRLENKYHFVPTPSPWLREWAFGPTGIPEANRVAVIKWPWDRNEVLEHRGRLWVSILGNNDHSVSCLAALAFQVAFWSAVEGKEYNCFSLKNIYIFLALPRSSVGWSVIPLHQRLQVRAFNPQSRLVWEAIDPCFSLTSYIPYPWVGIKNTIKKAIYF